MSTAVRVVVPNGDRVLAAPNGLAGWQLPRVPLTWAPAFETDDVAAASSIVGGPVAPVRRISDDAWELVARGRISVTASHWIGRHELGRLGHDQRIVEAWLALDPTTASFHRAEWHDEITQWVADTIAPVTGPATTLRHWEISAVVSVPTTAGVVVAKENLRGFDLEGPNIDRLRGLPGVPQLLAVDGPRLAIPFVDGRPGRDAEDVRVLEALGRFHRAAVGVVGIPTLWRTPTVHPVDQRAAVIVDALDVPDSVIHSDVHQGNVLIDTDDDLTIIDWTDAHIANPLLDLRICLVDHEDDPTFLDHWLASWDDCVDPVAVKAALPAICLMGSLTVAEFYRRSFDGLPATLVTEWKKFEAFWLRLVETDRARLEAST